MIRLLDVIIALCALLLLSPFLLIISLAILLLDGAPILFSQTRVGKEGRPFSMLKFRTMRPNAEKLGQLTVGGRDPRITKSGHALRRFKVDELPQLINVLKGDMSVVGPRPEVPKYVAMYSDEQKKVLSVRPGITDLASLEYYHESELLAKSSNPEQTYIEEVMPSKLEINQRYISNPTVLNYLKVIALTFGRILKG